MSDGDPLIDADRARAEQRYDDAERHGRRQFVHYLSLVHRHTVPMCARRSRTPVVDTAVNIDVNALEELVWFVVQCLERQGKAEAAFAYVERAAASVPLVAFDLRCIYLIGLVHMVLGNEREAADQARKVGDPIATGHPPIVEFCLDMLGDEMGLAKKLELAGWLRTHATSIGSRLQYAGLRALLLEMHDEPDAARSEIDDVIRKAESIDRTRFDIRDRWWLAIIYGHRWQFSGNAAHFALALKEWDSVPEEDLKAVGRAERRLQIAWLHLLHGDLVAAKGLLVSSLDAAFTQPAAIRLAETHIASRELGQAADCLEMVAQDGLEPTCELEFWTAHGFLAIAKGDRRRAATIVESLRKIDPGGVYFRQRRDEMCVTLLQFAQGHGSRETGAAGVLDFIRKLWRNVEIKPGIFGVSIDVKAVLARKDPRDSDHQARG